MDTIETESGKYLIKFNKCLSKETVFEMHLWCKENCNAGWAAKTIGALFESEKDAMAFKLRFV